MKSLLGKNRYLVLANSASVSSVESTPSATVRSSYAGSLSLDRAHAST